jgi:cytochrome c peroxidase
VIRGIFVAIIAAAACTGSDDGWQWDLPPGFPAPAVPAANPMSAAKVELGRYLFYDPRLSFNQTMSCASCHAQANAFSDGKPVPHGATGEPLVRNSLGLQNIAYMGTYTWANPVLDTLEQQVVIPMFNEHPVELGMTMDPDGILDRLRGDPVYGQLFAAAFPGRADPVDRDTVIYGMASFLRSMISGDSPYDRYQYSDDHDALGAAATRGKDLFFSERLDCYHCHTGLNFTGSFRNDQTAFRIHSFENDGLYNIGGDGSYPPGNQGLYELTGLDRDRGRFRVPTLRNVALTAPYMHDGSLATLDDVIDMYARGGRLIETGPLAGDGERNPNKNPLVRGFTLTAGERADLIAFLDSLTDTTFVSSPQFGNPW